MTDDFFPSAPRQTPEPAPMTPLGQEIAGRLKELFHGYSNRLDRSVQSTLGPSEIGTPCDRRLALSLLRVPATNPGGDNWASFVGSCIHSGLAEMLVWANAGSGRYAVEQRLELPSPSVPHGTADLIDRTLCMVLDHKAQGSFSRKKLMIEGPGATYRVQVHTYAHGARMRGEDIRHVAIVSWPRDLSSLDKLYVWTEPFSEQIALDALARVDRIAEKVRAAGDLEPLAIGRQFSIDSSDCKFCSFHAPGDTKGTRGCQGRE